MRRPLRLVLHAAPTKEDASNTRRSLLDGIRRWGLTMFEGLRLGDIELLAAELITNAVVHTGMPVQVTANWTGTAVRVEVTDSSTEEPVANDQFGEALTNGQGMNLVKALSNAWGVAVDHEAGTKIVWFECRPDHALTTGAQAVSEVASAKH
ncbi:ATP-binding protein [Kitasatospora sp. NPDC088548]|uniref:ATP-binding protein n=1 Tax=Kitasatospora sp. NPDC088548 TaxID=3364075 RepID=UPI0038183B42